ncbi:hypothetical protein KEJ33_01685 [Candidatus Bathyarchaeota archaeon]|nr:hypothetical protein [Candidatus Bathyarchaeota archaeon]
MINNLPEEYETKEILFMLQCCIVLFLAIIMQRVKLSAKIVIVPAAKGETQLLAQQMSGTKREYENYLKL